MLVDVADSECDADTNLRSRRFEREVWLGAVRSDGEIDHLRFVARGHPCWTFNGASHFHLPGVDSNRDPSLRLIEVNRRDRPTHTDALWVHHGDPLSHDARVRSDVRPTPEYGFHLFLVVTVKNDLLD